MNGVENELRRHSMKLPSQHIAFAKLADVAEGRTTGEQRAVLEAHLGSCSKCSTELKKLQDVCELMKSDRSEDAPRDVLALARNIFKPGNLAPSLIRHIVAALTFDSSMNLTPAFGVRASASEARQLLYSAEERDVDIRIAALGDQWIVTGQLLGGDCSGAQIQAEGDSGSAQATLNDFCEFSLPPLPSGSYTLRLLLPDAQLEIQSFELK